MALQGTLKDFSLADILQLIGLQKKTGVLTLRGTQETVTIGFLDGSVVAADSVPKRMEDRLGTVLVRSRQITQEQLQESLKIQKQTMKRLGTVLVEQKLIGQEAVREALRIQVSQSLHRLFRWRDGEYHFSQEQKLDYDRQNLLPLSTESILMEGARILDEWPMIEKRIGAFSGIYRRTPAAEEALTGAAGRSGPVLAPEDKTVLHEVDGLRSVQDVVESTPFSEFDTCRVLYELIGREMIERIASPVSATPAGKVAAKAPPAEAPIRKGLSAFAALGLLVVVTASIFTATRNPLNGLSVLRFEDPVSSSLVSQASLTRMERIRYALQVYFLQNKGYPKDLNYLVLGGLLRSADLKDPWGGDYLYRPLPGGFEIVGKDRKGVPDPSLAVKSVQLVP